MKKGCEALLCTWNVTDRAQEQLNSSSRLKNLPLSNLPVFYYCIFYFLVKACDCFTLFPFSPAPGDVTVNTAYKIVIHKDSPEKGDEWLSFPFKWGHWSIGRCYGFHFAFHLHFALAPKTFYCLWHFVPWGRIKGVNWLESKSLFIGLFHLPFSSLSFLARPASDGKWEIKIKGKMQRLLTCHLCSCSSSEIGSLSMN